MRRLVTCLTALSPFLTACTGMPAAGNDATRVDISLVNKLVWTNPVTGKPDGLRSAWPLAALDGHTEAFPLAQVRQCAPPDPGAQAGTRRDADPDPAGGAGVGVRCAWGVLKASRTIGAVRRGADGVALTLDLQFDIARTQQQQSPGHSAGMTIPADVAALAVHRQAHLPLSLGYGRVWRLPLGAGVSYELCVQRLDPARQPIDHCAIAFD